MIKLKLRVDNKFEEYDFGYSIVFLMVSINESLISIQR